jgi:hypothetical protein
MRGGSAVGFKPEIGRQCTPKNRRSKRRFAGGAKSAMNSVFVSYACLNIRPESTARVARQHEPLIALGVRAIRSSRRNPNGIQQFRSCRG